MKPMHKVALITGASSGLGADFARIHAQSGGDVVLVARRRDRLEALKHELEKNYGIQAVVIDADLANPQHLAKIIHELTARAISITYLINNAGFGIVGDFAEKSDELWQEMMQVNMNALVTLTHHLLADIKGNRGKILNVASTAALIPGPRMAIYFATKAFVRSFSLALAHELRPHGVSVTALLPGATNTEFAQTSGADKVALFNRSARSITVARCGYDAMIRGKISVISGLSWFNRLQLLCAPFMPDRIVLALVARITKQR